MYSTNTGSLFKLNLDGTRQTDSEGNLLYTYDSDDIMSYARAWTGLTKQSYLRGNTEDLTSRDRVDPLTIDREKRDIFPKTDLKGGYIGDGFPLCSDLPPRMHLHKVRSEENSILYITCYFLIPYSCY